MSWEVCKLSEPPFTLEHLKLRCSESGDCWEWGAAYRADRWPVISSRRDWDGSGKSSNRQFYVRHLMYWLKTGKPPILGAFRSIVACCDNPRCVNPDHMRLVTRKTVVRKMVESGGMSESTRHAKIAKTKRAKSKLSDGDVEQIRNSDLRADELAAQYGVSAAYIYMLRRNQFRRNYSNPFAGLGA
jgi:hypothetical protein